MCQPDELGAEFQGGLLDCFQVQVQRHSVLDHSHVEHDSRLRTALGIADGQDW